MSLRSQMPFPRSPEHRAAEPGLPEVVQVAPAVGLVLEWRRGRRSQPASAASATASVATNEVTQAHLWWDEQRRHLANKHRPRDIEKRLVCQRGHRLLLLVRCPSGLVPVAGTAQGGVVIRSSEQPDGGPMTLQEWPAGEHLPIASCGCHDHVEVSVHEARGWLEARRDKFVYAP